jgi:hypothetical protein
MERPLRLSCICTCTVQCNVFKLHVKVIYRSVLHALLFIRHRMCEIWSCHSIAFKHWNAVAYYGFSSKSYSNPCTGQDRPWEFQEFGSPIFPDTRHMNVVRLSTLLPAAFIPQKIFPLLISVRNWVDTRTRLRPESYVNEKFQWHHRASNPRPSGL